MNKLTTKTRFWVHCTQIYASHGKLEVRQRNYKQINK